MAEIGCAFSASAKKRPEPCSAAFFYGLSLNSSDLSDTVFAGRHQPLRVWMGCLYLMGLNLSNQQIAQELGMNQSDVHQMTHQLRQAIVDKKPEVQLSGEVECDEVYVTAGHKGHPEAVKKRGVKGGGASSKGFGAEGRLRPKSRRYSG